MSYHKGKLLEVHCGNCRPERHLHLSPEILRLPKRMPVPEVAVLAIFPNLQALADPAPL